MRRMALPLLLLAATRPPSGAVSAFDFAGKKRTDR